MAAAISQRDTKYLRGIVDMGSNGIRFSISNIQPPTARITPTLYQSRAGISLYDAQYSASGARQPIDDKTVAAVISSFQQFKRTCKDFGVPGEHITVLATEATRTAVNSEAFRGRIKESLGWEVFMLPKEEEGRVGAMGVASSLPEVSGLVMDLGGGSTQLSWLMSSRDGDDIQVPAKGAASMPYGAAAMSRRLQDAERSGKVSALEAEVREAVTNAYASLEVPPELERAAQKDGGFILYLSGGGFRGWGYVLMSQHKVKPYPLPVINGFKASRKDFLRTDAVRAASVSALSDEEGSIFRVSDRRAGQVPAVAFLVNALSHALPQVKEVRFCQGGVREGYLFSTLPADIRAQNPLVTATRPLSTSSSASDHIADSISSALPPGSTQEEQDKYKAVFTPDLLLALANAMYYHASHSKDLQATSALRSTTSGILAGVHGITHESRALLALLLCARWGGSVPPSDERFKQNLEALIDSPWTLWWVGYVGAVADLAAAVYPAGHCNEPRLRFRSSWQRDEKGRAVLSLEVALSDEVDAVGLEKEIKGIEKVGKRKRWIGGRDGVGHKVEVQVSDL